MPDCSPPKLCFACQKWHCSNCCKPVDMTILLGEGDRQSRQFRHLRQLDCCGDCRSFLEVNLWARVPPPACLEGVSRMLWTKYQAVAAHMTQLPMDLAQFEGLCKVAQLHNSLIEKDEAAAAAAHGRKASLLCLTGAEDLGESESDISLELPREYVQKLHESGNCARRSQAELESCIRAIAEIPVPGAGKGAQFKSRSQRLKEALCLHAERQLETLRPRLTAAALTCRSTVLGGGSSSARQRSPSPSPSFSSSNAAPRSPSPTRGGSTSQAGYNADLPRNAAVEFQLLTQPTD